MKKFWSHVTNGEYSVGCTGQTVYLYDSNGNEMGKFKDIIYAYDPLISPDGKIFIVKSAEGRLAVYSLESFSLVKKFRFSKVDCGQDDGFCFSPDGRYFINVERHGDCLHSAVSVYDTTDFSLVHRLHGGDGMMFSEIEYDRATDSYYVLGAVRGEDMICTRGFVAKYEDGQLRNLTEISMNEKTFYRSYLSLKRSGFAEKSFAWSYLRVSLDEAKSLDHSLAKIYAYYNGTSARGKILPEDKLHPAVSESFEELMAEMEEEILKLKGLT